MSQRKEDEIRQIVRDKYGSIARATAAGCGCNTWSCCETATANASTPENVSASLGYSGAQVSAVPSGSNMGLGCGNPHAIASLKKGETVLDLGSGGGFDCFLAAQAVGETGHVIGVDMTPEMVSKARENAVRAGYENVEFRLGEIESLAVADGSIDVIISNCVINLSTEKPRVFEEAFRALKPGGRLAISDVVAVAPLPDEIKNDPELYTGCIGGASPIDELEHMLKEAGFTDIHIQPVDEGKKLIRDWTPGMNAEDFVVSATIEAVKPCGCACCT
jgi:SAM-dependent methyltransferase